MSDTASQPGAFILGGSHGSLEIARSLGRRGIPVWFVTSDNPLPRLSRYVQRTFSWPGPDRDGAVSYLVDLARRHDRRGWVLFAGGDAEVRFIAQNHAVLAAAFTLTTPSWDTVRWTIDKRNMNVRAAELGLAQPLSHYPSSRDDLANIGIRFPVIVKPTMSEGRNAFVDAKAWRVDNPHALAARYDKAAALVGTDRIMVQELIPGDGRTQLSYAAVWDRGAPVGSLTARRLRQYPVDFGFTSTFVETCDLPEIEQAACRFLKSIDYSGLVEIEFKYDARCGSYKILDVNTRTWTWIALGAAVGVDFGFMQWQLALGRSVARACGRTGVTWRYLSRDLAVAALEVLAGTITPADCLHSLRHAPAAAVLAWDDPLPAMLDLPLVATRIATRRLSFISSAARSQWPARTASASRR